jgi:hypothetical protein
MSSPIRRDPPSLDAVPAFLRSRGDATRSAGGQAAQAGTDGAKTAATSSAPAPSRDEGRGSGRAPIDPAALPLPGLSRRKLATIAGVVAAAWLVLAFGRQVGEASAASNRADDLRAGNAALRQDVATLQRDLARVQDARFIALEARAFGLGGPGEVPFTLEANAPSLAPDAPGSAGVRLGVTHDSRSTLEVWLSLIFGGKG